MKKTLSLIILVVCIATISFPPTNTVPNSKIQSDDPPIVVFPPFNVYETQTLDLVL